MSLVDQQCGAMFVNLADADLWIAPRGTRTVDEQNPLEDVAVTQARAMPEVAWVDPTLYGGATLTLPTGATESITLVGTRAPASHGGPFHVVSGDAALLTEPDAITFEDSDREKFGGLNVGSLREVNGHRVKTVSPPSSSGRKDPAQATRPSAMSRCM